MRNFAITIFLVLGIWSCGKRITTTEHHSIDKDSISINKSFELTQNATFNDIGSVRPFDALKPMLWNGKWYYNVIIGFDKTVTKGVDIKANDNLSYTGSESQEKGKQTEKIDHSNVWIGLTAVIGTLFVLYLTLTKYKIL